nr:MAG TPA: hypothetical protein [Caudoviricetes sp.]
MCVGVCAVCSKKLYPYKASSFLLVRGKTTCFVYNMRFFLLYLRQ